MIHQKKSKFILDCSLTMAWCFEDESTDYSEHILDIATQTTMIVPAIWPLEIANVLTIAERKKRILPSKATAFKESLDMFLIEIDGGLLQKPIGTILELTRETGLTAYDACYLELAIRKNLPLATLDKELKKAAHKMKVILV